MHAWLQRGLTIKGATTGESSRASRAARLSIAPRRHQLVAVAHLDGATLRLRRLGADWRNGRLSRHSQELRRQRRPKRCRRRSRKRLLYQRPGQAQRNPAALAAAGTIRAAPCTRPPARPASRLVEATAAAAHHLVGQRAVIHAAHRAAQSAPSRLAAAVAPVARRAAQGTGDHQRCPQPRVEPLFRRHERRVRAG